MSNLLAVAMKKVGTLPPALRDDIGFELLERVAAWHELREKLAEGLADIKAGRVVQIQSAAPFIKELRNRHARRKA